MTKFTLVSGVALLVSAGISAQNAQGAALGFIGTGGFVAAGSIGDLTGCAGVCNFDSGYVPFTTGGLLADGLVVSGRVRQVITANNFQTTSALLLVTDIAAVNTGLLTVSDNLFLVSDLFDPSVAGPAGVGIVGAYVSNAGPSGHIYASTQAQMNYLTAGFLDNSGFNGVPGGFSLTTGSAFVSCVCPIKFWRADFSNNGPAGVQQLIGAINFTLGPGSSALLPGSLLLTYNNNEAITSEYVLPEPGTLATLGSALTLLTGLKLRRSRRT